MRYHNTALAALSFTLRSQRYEVAAGGEVEIPDRLAYAVKARGLPLEPVEGGVDGDEERAEGGDAKPTDPLALLWWTRAWEARRRSEAAEAELGDARSFLGLAPSIPLVAGLEATRGSVDDMAARVRGQDDARERAERELADVRTSVVAANEEIARLNALAEEQKAALAKANGKIGAMTAAAAKAGAKAEG